MPHGGVLTAERTDRTRTVDVDGRPVLRLVPTDTRITVHLVVPGIDRTVDISVTPLTAVRALHEAAQHAAFPTSRAEADLRHAVSGLFTDGPLRLDGPRAGRLLEDPHRDLIGLLGAAAFPVLAAAYDAGATPIDEIPRWASPILAAPDLRTAATEAFGDAATRPVVTALARSVVREPGRPVDLTRLGLALIGAGTLDPDRIARVLGATGQAPDTPIELTPTRIADARAATRRWGPRRTTDYLCEAAGDTASLRRFDDCLTWAIDLGPHAPFRLPRRLDDLADVYRSRITSRADDPPPPGRPQHPRTTRVTEPAGETVDNRRIDTTPDAVPDTIADAIPDYGLHFAPRVATDRPIGNNSPIRHPRWLRPLNGTHSATFTYLLPRTCGDLVRWSRLLGNCLHTYRSAAVAGASHLVGIEAGGMLRYVIEIDRDRHIRQFAGQANRRPSAANHTEILAHLGTLHVLV